MNPTELNLWTKINDFQLDVPGTEFTFSDRVARENGWSKEYTKRVILEYKKFIYLCCVSEQGVTPSDPVDQIWHLHLTYTKSYWIDFCQNTLGKEIHHNPTKGGAKEAKKFNNYYEHLKDIYRYHFDNDPPSDIWQPADIRFSDINFQRVNLKRYWLVKKPSRFFLSVFTLVLIGVIALLSIQADGYQIYLTVGIIVVGGTYWFVKRYRYLRNYPGRKKNKQNKNDGGCTGMVGCSGTTEGYYASNDAGSHHHSSGDSSGGHDSGSSGCSSGCSGCSSSGCSGCGGGGD